MGASPDRYLVVVRSQVRTLRNIRCGLVAVHMPSGLASRPLTMARDQLTVLPFRNFMLSHRLL